MTHSSDLLSEEQVQSFDENGFLVVDDVFPKEDLHNFDAALHHIVKDVFRHALRVNPDIRISEEDWEDTDRLFIELINLDKKYLEIIYDTVWQTGPFLSLVSNKNIRNCINQLLCRDSGAPLYGFINRCRMLPPGWYIGSAEWHQEVFQTVPDSRFLHVWAPLVHNSLKSTGTLDICVGSHKAGIAVQEWREKDNGVSTCTISDATVSNYVQKTIDLDVGQAVVMSGLTIHRSGQNDSDNVRYAIVGVFHDVGDPNFRPVRYDFKYREQTPKEYFHKFLEERK